MKDRLKVSFRSVIRSSAGTKKNLFSSGGEIPANPPNGEAFADSTQRLLEKIPDLDSWGQQLKIPQKELKLADRQTLLLYRTILDLIEEYPDLDLKTAPVHVAVGPARTNLTQMQNWESRIAPSEPWPMIQPASAIGLLPNTPLSWVSIKLGLRGEGAVWAGFHEAGYFALCAGMEALQSGAGKVVVASVNSPENYFVKNTLQRAGLKARSSPIEMGVAILLEVSNKTPQILFQETFAPEASFEKVTSFYSERLKISPKEVENSTICEGIFGRNQVSEIWGDPMTALFPFSLAMAEKLSGADLFCFFQGDLFGQIQSGVVKSQ